jgi:hypothetical protein
MAALTKPAQKSSTEAPEKGTHQSLGGRSTVNDSASPGVLNLLFPVKENFTA